MEIINRDIVELKEVIEGKEYPVKGVVRSRKRS